MHNKIEKFKKYCFIVLVGIGKYRLRFLNSFQFFKIKKYNLNLNKKDELADAKQTINK